MSSSTNRPVRSCSRPASPVRKVPLQSWIAGGRDQGYVVKRLRDESVLSATSVDKLRDLSTAWLGRPHDVRFRWDDKWLYCCELPQFAMYIVPDNPQA